MLVVVPAVKVPFIPSIQKLVTDNGSPSTSLSLVKTLPVAATPAGVLLISLAPTGRSLTGLTVIFKAPVSVPPLPSLTV